MTNTKRADSFFLSICDDPDCGAHLTPINRFGTPYCEMIIPKDAVPSFISHLQGLMYQKAVEEDFNG